MDDKANADANTIEDDELNTTAPNPDLPAWQMPEPVFRQTSGKLPQGFEKNYSAPAASVPEPEPASDSPSAETDSGDAFVGPYIEPRPKSSVLKLILVVLGLAAMIAFIVVFLTVLYFFFLRSSTGE